MAQPKKKNPKLSMTVLADRIDKVVGSTNDAIDSLKEGQSAILEALSKSNVGGVTHKDVPANLPKRHEADEQALPTAEAIDNNNYLEPAVVRSDVDSQEFKDLVAQDAFMNELIQITISPTNVTDMPTLFDVGVNGKKQIFRYGETKIVRRYIVEALARAKPVHYSNEQYVEDDGTDAVRQPATMGLRYPFSVVKDLNPNGRAWLNNILAQE